MRLKHYPVRIPYTFQIDNHRRAAVHILLFQAFKYIAILTANISEMGHCSGYSDAVKALKRNRIQQGARHNVVLWPVPVTYEYFMHDNLWQVMVDAALSFSMQYVMKNIPN